MAAEPRSVSSVIGDFVVAAGVGAEAWLRGLEGYTVVSTAGEPIQAAVRGAAQQGSSPDGTRWVAVADLIEGRLDDGARALKTGAPPPQREWRGRFAQVAWHAAERKLVALTDPFSSLPVHTLGKPGEGGLLLVATDQRVLARSPWCQRTVDLEAVYHFLNFAIVPAPRTIFADVKRLAPSTRLTWLPGRPPSLDRYWVAEYAEDLRGSDEQLAGELRERITDTVKAYRPTSSDDRPGWGCFLSGGTDSSSIVSILTRQAGRGGVKSFSIGFAEEGYDELGYARLAAEACGADPTFAKVSRAEAQALVARVVESYDQPFGNASAIPTLACVDLAGSRGALTMVAGDGGDEIFGGNQRYAKDRIMEAWYGMPAPVKAMGRMVGGAVGKSQVNFLNRVENFFDRASLPNPDRFYTDDSFASDHYQELLRPDFRRAVARDASLDFMREIFRLGDSGSPLHRVMRLDLSMAIAQNDIPKVHGAARSAGVTVRFPYLDPQLIAYTGRLPERYKVRGLTKRYLFKRAMRGILPDEILRKKKQGFGLPISVWLRSDAAFQASVKEVLFDDRARARGWWEPVFVERLLAEHERGSWDHADCIWRLFILERWLRRFVDAPA